MDGWKLPELSISELYGISAGQINKFRRKKQ